MSREIKYRAWVKERQAYFPVSNLFWGGGDTPLKVEISDNGSYREYINGEVIIEQYTGLKDKNGKEICEGDVCRLTYYAKSKKERKWHKHLEDINVVEFEDGYFKFSNTDEYGIGSELVFSDYGEWSTADGSYKYEAEIIGNIHKEIKKC